MTTDDDQDSGLSVSYRPAGLNSDGFRIYLATGAIPDGIPVELRVDDEDRTTAVYADGTTEDYGLSPSNPGAELHFLDEK